MQFHYYKNFMAMEEMVLVKETNLRALESIPVVTGQQQVWYILDNSPVYCKATKKDRWEEPREPLTNWEKKSNSAHLSITNILKKNDIQYMKTW